MLGKRKSTPNHEIMDHPSKKDNNNLSSKGFNRAKVAKVGKFTVRGNESETAMARTLTTPELFAELLTYLPNSDLLKCRLVNHSWNSQILPVLRKREIYTILDDSNFCRYQRCLEATPSAPRIGLGCSLAIEILDQPAYTDADMLADLQNYEKLVVKFESLKPGFLSRLRLDFKEINDMEASRSVAFSLIKHCAGGLRHLRLDLNHYKREHENSAIGKILLDCHFPQLEGLRFEINDNSYSKVLIAMLGNAPKLKILFIDFSDFEKSKVEITDEAKAQMLLLLDKFQPVQCSRLLEMIVNIHEENTFGIQMASKISAPALRKLTVKSHLVKTKWDLETNRRFTSFLENCPSLNTLDLYFFHCWQSETKMLFLPELPILRNLTHFGYHAEIGRGAPERRRAMIFCNLADLGKKLPKLTSITTTPGTYLYGQCGDNSVSVSEFNLLSLLKNRCAVKYLEFTGVNTLKLHDWFGPDSYLDPTVSFNCNRKINSINQLHRLFPNIRKVIICPLKQEPKLALDDLEHVAEFPHRVWTRIIHKCLEEFRGLQELVIENCFEDYFSEIWIQLQGQESGVQQFPGLTALKVPPLKCFEIDYFNQLNTPIIDLFNLLDLFPSLQALEIGTRFVGISRSRMESKLEKLGKCAPELKTILL